MGSAGRNLDVAKGRHLQVAALVYRRAPSGIEVLIVTSRETRRWVLPKGWPHRSVSLAQSALREAWEEAGVRGLADEQPVGRYTYDKRVDAKHILTCDVLVYPVRLVGQTDAFPEAASREHAWVSIDEAARRVVEPELSALLRQFAVPAAA